MCTFFEPLLYCYILGGCIEQFPGAQFYGKCILRVHKIKAEFRTLNIGYILKAAFNFSTFRVTSSIWENKGNIGSLEAWGNT